MKKIIYPISILCLILLLFAGCSVGLSEEIDTYDANPSTEDMFKSAPLIFLGQVTGENDGHYRNETTVCKDADGNPMYNYWVTPYTVEVKEVYKGDLDESVSQLSVSTLNFYSKEDMEEKNITADTYNLQVGEEIIFFVCYEEADNSYVPIYDNNGFYRLAKENTYYCGDKALKKEDIPQALKAAETNGRDLFAGTSYKAIIKPEHLAKENPDQVSK